MVLKPLNFEIKQAVLICDNFNDEFSPIQSDQQLALLRIVNCPIIDYTLQFLRANGIEQVIIFSSNAKKDRKYLEDRKWIKENDEVPFAIVMASDSLTSLGDVMRDVFDSDLVKNDFILINGNVIGGNIQLLRYLKEHIDRRKNHDKGSIMTMIHMKMNHEHRTRSKVNESILVVNRDTQKLLFYKLKNDSGGTKRKIDLPLELFHKNPNLKIHFDLQDTDIAICSMAVPQLFADNFDYNTKDDFIHGILVHEELLQNSIYIQTVENGAYGVKVFDAFSYDAVSQDIIERWSFPVVPDVQDDFGYHRHNIYKSSSVDLKFDSVLERNLVIGKNISIDLGARIKNSVIGENCIIGKNVQLDGCYLMNNVIVENDCQLSQCILSDNVIIRKNCQLKKGCILSANCVIGPDIILDKCTRLQAKPDFDEKIDTSFVGQEGKAYLYKIENEQDDEEIRVQILWGEENKQEDQIDCLSDESQLSDDELNDDYEDEEIDDGYEKFFDEVIASLARGLEEKIECKNLILEINCSKHAYNIPIKDLVCLVIKATLELPEHMDKSLMDQKQYFDKFQVILKHCLLLYQNYVKSTESQRDCLLTLENYTLLNGTLFSVSNFVRTITILYDKEILSEELILEWSRTMCTFPSTLDEVDQSERKALRSNETLNRFICWLNEAEEESSDDED